MDETHLQTALRSQSVACFATGSRQDRLPLRRVCHWCNLLKDLVRANQSAMIPQLSVIICSHNPRPKYLARVFEALRNQTLPKDRWELLLVDNLSKVPLASTWDISWYPNARHIVESELGLAPARRRGMQEAVADVLVFVDDDNILDENYLSETLRIEHDWPMLGVWGSGWITPDYELDPPQYLQKFVPYLAIRETPAPRWSNVSSCSDAIPWGAGMCVRASVAAAYCQFYEQPQIHITGRQGNSLSAGEDLEICIVSCKQGLGTGVFPALKITHLIPKERISENYFVKIAEGAAVSGLLLKYKWDSIVPRSPFAARGVLSILRSILFDHGVDRRMYFAWVRGLIKARRIISGTLSQNLMERKVHKLDPAIARKKQLGGGVSGRWDAEETGSRGSDRGHQGPKRTDGQ